MVARIRTIKPEFFRHESLQDLEVNYPGSYVMLLFAGLWTQCDKNGVFEWKPRQLKLDILPFIEFDIVASLVLLCEAKIVSPMLHREVIYGFIPSFKTHQRINGKESQDSSKFPSPEEMTCFIGNLIPEKRKGSNREATGITGREGKGREQEEELEGKETESLSGLEKPNADRKIIPYQTILENMNQTLNTNFKNTDTFKKLVRARINEGFEPDDFLMVCQKKFIEWGTDLKMMQYLRPDTLFGNKMNSYLGGNAASRPVSERERINYAAGQAFLQQEDVWSNLTE